MPSLKAIRRRIATVQNTKQITRAMKLVSTAKLRRAQEAALSGRVFGEKLQNALARVCLDFPGGSGHPLLSAREEVRTRRVIAVAADRGLCGAFNVSVFKEVRACETDPGVVLETVALGRKMTTMMRRIEGRSISDYENLGEDIVMWPLAEIAEKSMADYTAGGCDEVVLYYTKFASLVSQQVVREVVLPVSLLPAGENQASALEFELMRSMTGYDPEPEQLFSYLLRLAVVTKLRQAALDSKASEHAARMRAMDSATRNADELIGKLRLYYNRARQRAITLELIDIVGGAEALK